MFGVNVLEVLIVLLGLLILFGSPKVPQLVRSLGGARRAFKEGHARDADGTEHRNART